VEISWAGGAAGRNWFGEPAWSTGEHGCQADLAVHHMFQISKLGLAFTGFSLLSIPPWHPLPQACVGAAWAWPSAEAWWDLSGLVHLKTATKLAALGGAAWPILMLI
jgi:hypothetical protein